MADEAQSKAHDAAPAAEVVVSEALAEEKVAVTEAPHVVTAPEAVVAEESEKPAEEAAPEAGEKKPKAEEGAPPAETTEAPSVSLKEESTAVPDPVDPEKKALDDFKQLVQAALANNEFAPPPPPPSPPTPPAKEEEPAPAKEEESKPEEPAAPVTEEPKIETEEPPKPAETETPAPPVAAEVEPSKPAAEEEPVPPVKEEPLPPPPPPVEEKAVAADEDGAKTVEAIEETVIAVTGPAPATTEEVTPAAEEATKEPPAETPAPPPAEPPEEVFIWGVPLVGDEKSDTILLKFLHARDFKVKDAMAMLKNSVIWRKQFGIEALLEEDLGLPELEKAVFMHGVDKEGHPVCYNVYGEFQNKELYEKAFGDEEKRQKFLKWRIQYLEKGIRELLDFSPGGISSMVQVTDLKNTPRLGKHRQATKQAVTLLQDNYPEFIAKKVFINVPWWYLAFNRMISPFFTQRTKSKFVFAGPSKSAETLFNAEDGYTVIVQKTRKLIATDEPVIKTSFKIGEPGKIVLNIENPTSKKKKLLYRSKAKSSAEST
ncbi:hypothetical protein BHE74_00015319 [Ensete ventricosum]|nr:hypothetical protein BHE74_00015319 [Ensete ventricosum]